MIPYFANSSGEAVSLIKSEEALSRNQAHLTNSGDVPTPYFTVFFPLHD